MSRLFNVFNLVNDTKLDANTWAYAIEYILVIVQPTLGQLLTFVDYCKVWEPAFDAQVKHLSGHGRAKLVTLGVYYDGSREIQQKLKLSNLQSCS